MAATTGHERGFRSGRTHPYRLTGTMMETAFSQRGVVFSPNTIVVSRCQGELQCSKVAQPHTGYTVETESEGRDFASEARSTGYLLYTTPFTTLMSIPNRPMTDLKYPEMRWKQKRR
jgi:hypothetical protein